MNHPALTHYGIKPPRLSVQQVENIKKWLPVAPSKRVLNAVIHSGGVLRVGFSEELRGLITKLSSKRVNVTGRDQQSGDASLARIVELAMEAGF